MIVTAQQGEILDALCYRVTHRTAGLVEAALAANPGLAEHGPRLPHGCPVVLPDTPVSSVVLRPLQLWD